MAFTFYLIQTNIFLPWNHEDILSYLLKVLWFSFLEVYKNDINLGITFLSDENSSIMR